MDISRRVFLGGAVAAGAGSLAARSPVQAQEGTPSAVDAATPAPVGGGEPGFGIARVRKVSDEALNQAIFPHVMHRFLPAIETVPGHAGYVFAFYDADPAAAITLTLVADEAAAAASGEAAQAFVSGLDPRFATETPMAEQGPLRIYRMTDRPGSELPPFLHGCYLTIRQRANAPGADMEAVVAGATEVLTPTLAAMDGFVLYAWMQVENGRVAINIWETREQLEAGNQAVSEYVAENTISTTVGDPIVHTGEIGYADFVGQ